MIMAREMAKNNSFDLEKWALSRIPGMLPNQKQGRDKGIDGRGKIFNGGDDDMVLAQVKSGKFSVSHFRDFWGVMGRGEAALGIYITMDKVTSIDAKSDAYRKGEFKMGATSYPKVQLWSIAEYFNGRQPRLPSLADPWTGKQMQTELF